MAQATLLLPARTRLVGQLLPPDVAAHLAAYAEHTFPVMLVLGLEWLAGRQPRDTGCAK